MKKQPKVVYISEDECQVSLNVGTTDGVSLNDKFLVYSLSDHEIIDPDTKESLGFLEFVKGTGTVTHVQEKLCTITSTKHRRPERTIRKQSPLFTSPLAWNSSAIEETIIDGNDTLLPFENPQKGDFAKPV